MNTESQQQIADELLNDLSTAFGPDLRTPYGRKRVLSAIERATEASNDDLAQGLFTAWSKYVQLFGEQPHGTLKQLRAMLEFIPAAQPQHEND
jgi:hypothetical protein